MKTLDRSKIEIRTFEIRRGEAGSFSATRASSSTGRTISGYAAVFSSPAKIADFTERIMPGAFDVTLRDGANDPLLLWNHESGKPLSRKSAGLTLRTDSHGLYFECEAPNVSYAEDVLELLRTRICAGCSFGFSVLAERWSADYKKRDLLEVKLYEISLTPTPAYSSTSAQARGDSWDELCEQADIAVALEEARRTLDRLELN